MAKTSEAKAPKKTAVLTDFVLLAVGGEKYVPAEVRAEVDVAGAVKIGEPMTLAFAMVRLQGLRAKAAEKAAKTRLEPIR